MKLPSTKRPTPTISKEETEARLRADEAYVKEILGEDRSWPVKFELAIMYWTSEPIPGSLEETESRRSGLDLYDRFMLFSDAKSIWFWSKAVYELRPRETMKQIERLQRAIAEMERAVDSLGEPACGFIESWINFYRYFGDCSNPLATSDDPTGLK